MEDQLASCALDSVPNLLAWVWFMVVKRTVRLRRQRRHQLTNVWLPLVLTATLPEASRPREAEEEEEEEEPRVVPSPMSDVSAASTQLIDEDFEYRWEDLGDEELGSLAPQQACTDEGRWAAWSRMSTDHSLSGCQRGALG